MFEKKLASVLQYLYEMSRNKNMVENRIGNRCVPITNHVIKLLKWKDDNDFHKHQVNIDNWFLETLNFKYNKKRPNQETFYELLFSDRIDSVDKLNKIIKKVLHEYSNLPVIREDNEQIYKIMQKMMWEICGDLSKNNYKDFEEYYFPKYSK